MALVFYDENGISPMMPGVFVTLTDATGDTVGTGWTFADGSIAISVQGATPYSAAFRSSQLTAGLTVSFFGNAVPGADTIVPVPGATPTLYSQLGSALALRDTIPTGWIEQGDPGEQAITEGMGAGNAAFDAQIARLIASMRGQTCQGADLDSWAADLFGSYVRRYPGEDDPTFYTRCISLMGPRRTLAAIKLGVVAFYTATLRERIVASQPNIAFDQSGALDQIGGYDTFVVGQTATELTPVIDVWDSISQPQLAAQYGIAPGQFVVQIGFTNAVQSWFLDNSFLDFNTFLMDEISVSQSQTPPDSRLGVIVNLIKAAGARPIYLVTSTS